MTAAWTTFSPCRTKISEHIAGALDQTFTSFSTKAIDPAVYDLYLHASPMSFVPDELRTNVGLLEVATQRAPDCAEAWGRLAFLRAWLRLYQPFAARAASGGQVTNEAARALALDPQNVDALLAQFFVLPPFGRFVEVDAVMKRLARRRASASRACTSAGIRGRSDACAKAPTRRSAHSHWMR